MGMTKTPLNLKHHYFVIDILKTIAVQFIILHHLSNYGIIPIKVHELLPAYIDWIGNYGKFAVQIFLVVGGYLSVKNLPIILEKFGFFRTVFNRYLRLAPAYIVALCLTILCAAIARSIHYEEYIGEPETFTQVLAHFLFLHKVLGFESISVGVWYVAIDTQLFLLIALLLFLLKSYKNILILLALLMASSMMYFSTHSLWEDYFIYFIGAYGLGVIAFLAEDSSHPDTKVPARILLILFGILILSDTFFEVRIKNIIDLCVALLLAWRGKYLYHSETLWIKLCIWFSQRSYCAFLIHFSILLLGNSMYYHFQFQSSAIALWLMIGIWIMSWVVAHLLYQFVEYPSRKLQVRAH
jgi:peptidoglycan/LPS O-acetylase OafA/YrhL